MKQLQPPQDLWWENMIAECMMCHAVWQLEKLDKKDVQLHYTGQVSGHCPTCDCPITFNKKEKTKNENRNHTRGHRSK